MTSPNPYIDKKFNDSFTRNNRNSVRTAEVGQRGHSVGGVENKKI